MFDNNFQNFDKSWTLASDSDTPKAGPDGLTASLSPNHDIATKTNEAFSSDVEICTVITSNSPEGSTDFSAAAMLVLSGSSAVGCFTRKRWAGQQRSGVA